MINCPVLGNVIAAHGGGVLGLGLEWLTRIVEPDPPIDLIWGSLDDPLRLAMAQSWLLGTRRAAVDDADRDVQAAQLASRESNPPLFAEFCGWLIAHYRHVYRDIEGRPCLLERTEVVGLDLELVVFSSEEHVGTYAPGEPFPAHSFITRHVSADRWVIAANARRLPGPRLATLGAGASGSARRWQLTAARERASWPRSAALGRCPVGSRQVRRGSDAGRPGVASTDVVFDLRPTWRGGLM